MYEQHTKAADAATVVSTVGAVMSWFADAIPVVQFLSGVIAIITGIFAIVYHYKKIQSLSSRSKPR